MRKEGLNIWYGRVKQGVELNEQTDKIEYRELFLKMID